MGSILTVRAIWAAISTCEFPDRHQRDLVGCGKARALRCVRSRVVAEVTEDDLWLSVPVLGEIRKGIELARRPDPVQTEAPETWLGAVVAGFGARAGPIIGVEYAHRFI